MTRRRVALGRASIAAAALAVVDRDGANGFSMRAVAAEMNASPMSLYHHVADRADLVTLMVDATMREVAMPTPSGDGWRDDLWHLASWLRASATRHPHLSSLVGEMHAATETMVGFGEYWVDLWHRSDLPAESALDAAVASLSCVIAVVTQPPAPIGGPTLGIEQLASTPHLDRAVRSAPHPEQLFELVVRGAIDGIHARAAVAASPTVSVLN